MLGLGSSIARVLLCQGGRLRQETGSPDTTLCAFAWQRVRAPEKHDLENSPYADNNASSWLELPLDSGDLIRHNMDRADWIALKGANILVALELIGHCTPW